jgi:hypothetical protein
MMGATALSHCSLVRPVRRCTEGDQRFQPKHFGRPPKYPLLLVLFEALLLLASMTARTASRSSVGLVM